MVLALAALLLAVRRRGRAGRGSKDGRRSGAALPCRAWPAETAHQLARPPASSPARPPARPATQVIRYK